MKTKYQKTGWREFQHIFDSNLIGMVWGCADGRICEANAYCSAIWGLSPEEIREQHPTWESLTPADYKAVNVAHLQELVQTGATAPFEKPCLHRDGSSRWILLWFTKVDHPRYDLAAFIIDITERKEAEEQSERRLKIERRSRQMISGQLKNLMQIFDKAPVLVAVLRGPTFVYDLINEEYQKLIGGRDVLGLPLLEAIPRFDPALYGYLQRVYETQQRIVAHDHPVFSDWENTGLPVKRYFSFIYEPLLDDDGRTKCVCVVAFNVTERKEMEEKLLLSQKLSSLGMMAGGIGHEINNPLAYALLNLDLMKKELSRVPAPGVEGRLVKIQNGLERIQNIVRGLRIFSQTEDKEMIAALNLHDCLDSTVELAHREVSQKARLLKEYGEIPPVQGTTARLSQVFLQLLINAAQAIPENHPEDHRIRLATFYDDQKERVCVSVTDTGAGLNSDELKNVFDPGAVVVTSAIGLSLAICQGIINSLGGDMDVCSRPGEGTQVTVSLLRSYEALSKDAESQVVECRPESMQSRILVVDDEELLLELIDEILSPHYQVECVSDGTEALRRLLGSGCYDVILCDLMLPDFSGMDIFEKLRREKPGLEEKMIFISGGAYTTRADRFLRSGEVRRLFKPFKAAELLKAVSEIVHKD